MQKKAKKLTRHVVERAKQRIHLDNDLPPDSVIKKMMKYGLTLGDFTGDFYSYLHYIKNKKYKSISLRVMYDSILIYNKNSKRAITVYPVPPQFLPVEQFIKSEENREIALLMQRIKEKFGIDTKIELQVLTIKPNDVVVGLCINNCFENYGMGKSRFAAEENALSSFLERNS